MPVSKSTVAIIQKSGEALMQSTTNLFKEMSQQNARVLHALTNSPAGADVEATIKDLRKMATLHHELKAIEESLKAVYLTALDMTERGDETILLPALPHAMRSTPEATVQDVQAKTPAVRKLQKSRASSSKPSPALAKLQDYLAAVLSTTRWTPLKQSDVAAAAQISLGSANKGLKKLVEAGFVKADGKGAYRMG